MILRVDRGWIEIRRGGMEDPADLDVQVQNGEFRGAVHGIFPGNAGSFLAALRAIEEGDATTARLEGSENFAFWVESIDRSGAFWAGVHIEIRGCREPGMQQLCCVMQIYGEYWASMVRELRPILFGR